MASISITFNRATAQAPYPVTGNYALADADLDQIIPAYQQEANTSVNGTATARQVYDYIMRQACNGIIAKIQAHNTTVPVVPPPIVIT